MGGELGRGCNESGPLPRGGWCSSKSLCSCCWPLDSVPSSLAIALDWTVAEPVSCRTQMSVRLAGCCRGDEGDLLLGEPFHSQAKPWSSLLQVAVSTSRMSTRLQGEGCQPPILPEFPAFPPLVTAASLFFRSTVPSVEGFAAPETKQGRFLFQARGGGGSFLTTSPHSHCSSTGREKLLCNSFWLSSPFSLT